MAKRVKTSTARVLAEAVREFRSWPKWVQDSDKFLDPAWRKENPRRPIPTYGR